MNNRLVIYYNKYIIILAVIMFLNLNGFYMLNNLPVSNQDISVILEVMFIAYVMLFVKGKYHYSYGKYIFVAIVFVFTSSFMANYSYLQPLWYGIRAQRQWICAILMYFPIAKLIRRGSLTKRELLGMIDVMNIIYIILIVLQYFLENRVQFMEVGMGERYGSIRLFVDLTFILISYYMHLLRLITTECKHGTDIFFVIATLFINIAVTKSRMGIAALLIASALTVLSIRFTIKKLILIIVLFILAALFLSSNVGQDMLALIFNPDNSIGGNTSEIRELGRTFYIQSASKEWRTLFFGCGFANLDWPQAVIGSGYNLNYNYNDNGMFGLFFFYGLTFVIWTITFYTKLLKVSWKSEKFIFFMLIADLIGCFSLIPLIYTSTLGFALVCVILEENKDTKCYLQC